MINELPMKELGWVIARKVRDPLVRRRMLRVNSDLVRYVQDGDRPVKDMTLDEEELVDRSKEWTVEAGEDVRDYFSRVAEIVYSEPSETSSGGPPSLLSDDGTASLSSTHSHSATSYGDDDDVSSSSSYSMSSDTTTTRIRGRKEDMLESLFRSVKRTSSKAMCIATTSLMVSLTVSVLVISAIIYRPEGDEGERPIM